MRRSTSARTSSTTARPSSKASAATRRRRARPSSASTRTPSGSSTPPRSTGWSRGGPPDEVNAAILDTIAANRLDACYIRPIVYRGAGQLGVNPLGSPVEAAIMVWDWGKYLGEEALEQGVDVCVSSWTRMAPNTLPAHGQERGQLRELAAHQDGGGEGRLLRGHRARRRAATCREGSGENLFVGREGKLLTPPLVSSVLPGITRDSVITLARKARHPGRREGPPARDALPRRRGRSSPALRPRSRRSGRSTGITVGKGRRGPVTEALQKAFFDVIECRAADAHGWLTFVPAHAAAATGGAR